MGKTPDPPHDLDAEAVVLSASMLEADAFALIADKVESWHFFAEANRRIWEAIASLTDEGRTVDLVAVVGWLRDHDRIQQAGGAAYVAQILDSTPAVANIEEHAARVVDRARLRKLIAECRRIAVEAHEPMSDVQGFIDKAEHAVYQIASAADRSGLKTAKDAAKRSWEQIVDASKRDRAVHRSTGLVLLDRKTGGLHDDEVTVVAARPGMGKTGFVLQIAEAVAEAGQGVVVFELEMPDTQLVKRRVASQTSVELGRITDGFIRREEWTLLSAAHDRFGNLPIWIEDTPGVSLLQMRATLRRVKSECKRLGVPLGLAVVDYLQLMEAERARQNSTRDEDISQITRGIKRLAREMHIPILEVSQLNRGLERSAEKRPQMSDLRESGAIEQDADNIIFLYRPEYYLKEKTPEDDKGIVELIIEKQRNRGTGTVRVRFDGPTVTFMDVPVPEPENEPYYQRSLYEE